MREAAHAARLPNHSILVRYEQGSARPPLERLAALAATYHTTLAALLVERDDLAPLVAAVERADTATLSRLRAALAPRPAPASPPEQSDVPF